MFLQVGTSTPVVNNLEVVTITGVLVSISINFSRCPLPTLPSSETTRTT